MTRSVVCCASSLGFTADTMVASFDSESKAGTCADGNTSCRTNRNTESSIADWRLDVLEERAGVAGLNGDVTILDPCGGVDRERAWLREFADTASAAMPYGDCKMFEKAPAGMIGRS